MIDLAAVAFATLFVVIDPVGLVPLFAALTAGMAVRDRVKIAVRGTLIAFFILALFAVAGEALLSAMGIGMPAFRISGGAMLFLLALDMLFEGRSQRRERTAEGKGSGAGAEDPSVFPLATPLIAGPGAMAAMILLTEGRRDDPVAMAVVLGVAAGVLVLCLVLFLLSLRLEKLLGPTGIRVVTRLMGVLLGALAIQFMLDGLTAAGLAPGG